MNNPIVPTHYGGRDNPYEIVKIIDALGLDFQLGNTLKYIARAGKKDPSKHIEDLLKGKEYIDLEIAKIKAEETIVAPMPIEEDVREAFDWTPPKFNSLQEEFENLKCDTTDIHEVHKAVLSVGVTKSDILKYADGKGISPSDVIDLIIDRKLQVDELVGN
jgi:hypothetical protein